MVGVPFRHLPLRVGGGPELQRADVDVEAAVFGVEGGGHQLVILTGREEGRVRAAATCRHSVLPSPITFTVHVLHLADAFIQSE